MIDFWDRTTLSLKRPPTPSEKSEDDAAHHPPSGKKGKGGKGWYSFMLHFTASMRSLHLLSMGIISIP